MTSITWSKTSPIELLDGLGEFVAVVEAGSIAGAARALDLPRETLGRRLGQLEERLGVGDPSSEREPVRVVSGRS